MRRELPAWGQLVNGCNVAHHARHAAFELAGRACQTCGIRGTLHTHVDAGGSVRALCSDCHHTAHRDPAGMLWNDAAEMAAYWEPYWAELERD